jgi:hypothetical protein
VSDTVKCVNVLKRYTVSPVDIVCGIFHIE